MCNQSDIVLSFGTNDVVTSDFNCRVRINVNDSINQCGLTANSQRCVKHCIFVCGGITINCKRRILEMMQVNTRDHLTISVPSVVTIGHRSNRHGNLTTEANSGIRNIREFDNRCGQNLHAVKTNSSTT